MVVTEAGTHPRVAALVYIAAFVPDIGESVRTLAAGPQPSISLPPPPVDGFLADAQVACGVEALDGSVYEPAWRGRPSWYLVAVDDRMIPAPTQRAMSRRAGSTVVEVPGGHAVHMSQPDAVAGLIRMAAAGRPPDPTCWDGD